MKKMRSRGRVVWRTLGVCVAATLVLLVSPALTHLRAASLLVRFTDPGATFAIADYSRYEVRESPAMVDGQMRARIYAPRGVEHPTGIVLVHGVHRLGIDEPRLVRFARTIAATGVTVLTPELDELCDYRIDPRSVDTIGNAARDLRIRLGVKSGVGVMGLSFAGGLSLIAAADARYAGDIAFVVAVGAHDDLSRVLRFFATNAIENPDGTQTLMHAHDYGPLVLVYSHVEAFFPAADVAVARDALRAWLWEYQETARAQAKGLSAASREKIEKLFAHDVSGISGEMLALIAREESVTRQVSPRTFLRDVHVPIYLLHGAGDSVIPPTETLWLAHDAAPGTVQDALVSKAIEHVEMSGAPSARDKWALVDFMSDVLREADRER